MFKKIAVAVTVVLMITVVNAILDPDIEVKRKQVEVEETFEVISSVKFPETPDPIEITSNRCELISPRDTNLTDSKRIYNKLCGPTFNLYKCVAVGQAEFFWRCWGFREGIDPTTELNFDKVDLNPKYSLPLEE